MPSRVAVLDLRARDDVFLGDGGLARLAARLEREGHDVVRVRATWNGEPTLELDDRRADVVVLGRAWDAALLDALRRTFGASRLVRLTNGVAAALDDRFDHVVDERGLLALLAGEEAPIPRAPPRTAREIRALRVFDQDDGPETAGSLPAIRGPSTGCPYLVDASRNARFARLALDAEVQTKGCTFCLDNTGAYAAASEDETVGRWLSQLRTLRSAHGEGRFEVLLVDERPHPFLPRLFRELDSPVELLIKSRVDWLLEHEAALAEACTLAERTGSIVHVYLVGFESFDDDTLALFNKGTDAAANVRAIALLRGLAARFPRTFEHRRLRAHGFVAFTPWTTPEALLRNAATMREVGFSELRADAARTRLRLYPRTPLHALAKAEGLLVDHFDATRTDRAAEQGYDASFAWRFADRRVEAIFRACDGLRARARDLPDADLLELATRFVLRWPGLADAPEVAHLPLIRAVEEHAIGTGALPSTLRAAAIVDHELERLAAGEKRALLKEGVPTHETEGLIRAYRAMGFVAAVVETHGLDETGGTHVEGGGRAIVAVAGNEADLELVTRLQRARDTRAMGAWMGYPACCVEAFLAQPDRRDNVENERWTLRRTGGAPLDPRLGRLGPVRLVSHHPCRADCAASIAIADAALARIGAASPEGERWVRETLQKPVLFLDHARSATLRGRFDGARFVVQSFESSWQPGDVDAIELAFDHVVLVGRERRVVRADRPLLVVPGEPVPAPTAQNLAPSLSPSYVAHVEVGGHAARERVRAAVANGARTIVLGGRAELADLASVALAARGAKEVELVLDEGALVPERALARLAEAGVTRLVVTILRRNPAPALALLAAWPGESVVRLPIEESAPSAEQRLKWIHRAAPELGRFVLAPRVADANAAEDIARCEALARRERLDVTLATDHPFPPCLAELSPRARALLGPRLRDDALDAPQNDAHAACATCALARRCTITRNELARLGGMPRPVADAGSYARPARKRLRVLGAADVKEFFHVDYDYAVAGGEASLGARPTSRIGVVYRCNQTCTFCELADMDVDVRPEDVRDALDKARARGSTRVILTGGEPTLCKELVDHVAYAQSIGFEEIELQTNAVLLDRAGFARALREAGLTSAQVSLHGPDGAISDRLTSAPGTHARTLRGVDALLEAGVRVLLNHLVFKDNVPLLDSFVELLITRWGAHRDRLLVQFHSPRDEFASRDEGLRNVPRYAEYAVTLRKAVDHARAAGIHVHDLQDPTGIPALCVLGADQTYLGAIAAQRNAPRYHRWESSWLTHVAACEGCALREACMGIPKHYLELHGDAEFRPFSREGA